MLLLGEGHLRWILRAYAPDHWTNDIPPRARALCAAPSGRLANNGTCVYRKPHPAMISVLAGPSHSLTTLSSSKWSGQVSALRRFPSAPGAPVGKALPGRYALRNGRKLMAKLNINGKMRDVRVEADTPLLWVIREHVGLTGTKYGCGIAQCGACSVHINGDVQRSCSIRVGDVKATDKIVTIEGLSASSSHPVQKAWASVDVPQCGYCQSGQIMAAAALLKKIPKPTDKDIDEAMTNICRCGTYQRIRAAVHLAAGTGKGGGSVIHMGAGSAEDTPIAAGHLPGAQARGELS